MFTNRSTQPVRRTCLSTVNSKLALQHFIPAHSLSPPSVAVFFLVAKGDFGKQTIATLLAGVTAAANFEAAGAANKLQISSTASVSVRRAVYVESGVSLQRRSIWLSSGNGERLFQLLASVTMFLAMCIICCLFHQHSNLMRVELRFGAPEKQCRPAADSLG